MIGALLTFAAITVVPAGALALVYWFATAPEAPEWMDDD